MTTRKTKTIPKCSICGAPVEAWPGGGGYGHNPEPVVPFESGPCCTHCNDSVVIPARLGNVKTYTPTEAARLLGVDRTVVYRLVREGKLRTVKGFDKSKRISHAELVRFVNEAEAAS